MDKDRGRVCGGASVVVGESSASGCWGQCIVQCSAVVGCDVTLGGPDHVVSGGRQAVPWAAAAAAGSTAAREWAGGGRNGPRPH